MGWQVQDIDEAETVEAVTDDDVQAAVDEAEAAEAAVTQLEDRVVNGDDTITADDIEQQRGRSRFARLRAKAVERKAERARQAARLRALEQLRQDIDAHSDQIGATLAKALEKAEKALTDFYRLAAERDATVYGFRQRAAALDLPRHTSPFQPGKEHAHVGLNQRQVIAGTRRIEAGNLDVDGSVNAMTRRARDIAKTGAPGPSDAKLYGHLASIDARDDATPSDDKVFYTNETGRVFTYDPEYAPTDVAVKAGGLVKISRREAERLGGKGH